MSKLTGKQIEAIAHEFRSMTLWKHLASEMLPNGSKVETIKYRGQRWCFVFTANDAYRGNYSTENAELCRAYVMRVAGVAS